MTYNPRKWRIIEDLVYIDKEFVAELGFVPRTDVIKWGNGIQRIFYPKSGVFNTHAVQALALTYWKPTLNYKKTDHLYRLSWDGI